MKLTRLLTPLAVTASTTPILPDTPVSGPVARSLPVISPPRQLLDSAPCLITPPDTPTYNYQSVIFPDDSRVMLWTSCKQTSQYSCGLNGLFAQYYHADGTKQGEPVRLIAPSDQENSGCASSDWCHVKKACLCKCMIVMAPPLMSHKIHL